MRKTGDQYRVVVEKDYLKFSAAHFIAYKGFREPLHRKGRVGIDSPIAPLAHAEGCLHEVGRVVELGQQAVDRRSASHQGCSGFV